MKIHLAPFVAALLALSACALLGAPSKVRAGELYSTGQERYDTYFTKVNAEQVAAAKWPEERKAARKPLVDALSLSDEPSDSTITQATRDRLAGGTVKLDVSGAEPRIVPVSSSKLEATMHDVFQAVERTAKEEIERGKHLNALPAKLDELDKGGRELEAHIAEDFAKEGGQRPFEVKQELRASFDVLAKIGESAKREAKTADDFVADLSRAVSVGSDTPRRADKGDKPEKGDKPDKPEKTDKGEHHAKPPKHDETPPAPKPPKHEDAPPVVHAETLPPAPPPKPPPPKPADTGEVFTP